VWAGLIRAVSAVVRNWLWHTLKASGIAGKSDRHAGFVTRMGYRGARAPALACRSSHGERQSLCRSAFPNWSCSGRDGARRLRRVSAWRCLDAIAR
jgi:hypothetical protein